MELLLTAKNQEHKDASDLKNMINTLIILPVDENTSHSRAPISSSYRNSVAGPHSYQRCLVHHGGGRGESRTQP